MNVNDGPARPAQPRGAFCNLPLRGDREVRRLIRRRQIARDGAGDEDFLARVAHVVLLQRIARPPSTWTMWPVE